MINSGAGVAPGEPHVGPKKQMKIADRFQRWLFLQVTKGQHDGIKLCDANFNDTDDNDFLEHVNRALSLIHDRDPRRYARVKRELDFIINQELLSGGAFLRQTRACAIDFGKYRFGGNDDWSLIQIARTIVHEATHGHLYSKGIKSTPENRLRIERLCSTEENRFSARLDTPYKDHLQISFDPKPYQKYYSTSRMGYWLAVIKRIREERRKAQQEASPRTRSPERRKET